MTRVGFVGLGGMGGRIAARLADDHAVAGFDLRDEAVEALVDAGGTPAATAADAAADAEVVFLSLPGPDEVEAVVEEIDGALESGAVLVDLTTSTPGTTEAVADRFDEADVLGAPVSGGVAGAERGTLSVMVGGDPAVLEACRPLFEAFAADVVHVGAGVGDGHAAKLLNNYLSQTALVAASEALALGRRAGLDGETLLEVFNASSGRNSATEDKLPDHVLTGDYDLGFSLALTEKDARLLGRFADEQDAPLLLAGVVRNLVGYARADHGGDADMTRLHDFMADRVDR
ncbi:MAG: NAD(P)-dependent oxidoreductase [Haloferacaceae archaeon]